MKKEEKIKIMNECALKFLTLMAEGSTIENAKILLAKFYNKVDKETIRGWLIKTGIDKHIKYYRKVQKNIDTANYYNEIKKTWQK